MSVNVKYKNNSIAELSDTGTKTLKTAGKYCEADIVVENTKDGGATITDGIVIKAFRQPDNWIQEVDYYCESGRTPNSVFSGAEYRFLTKINYKSKITIISIGFAKSRDVLITFPSFEYVTTIGGSAFYGCGKLDGLLTLPLCATIGDSAFRDTKITGINAPECSKVLSSGLRSNALKTVHLPKLAEFVNNTFYGCSALEAVQLGSVGHSVSKVLNNDFYGCTNASLNITVYTVATYVDTLLANIRNGATNATIIIKAAEATTYNDTEYAAGDTIVTSTVETGGTT